MFRINYRILLYNSLIILFIFFIDRLSKIYIINLVKKENVLDIYLTPYLNLYLIWNKGVAFGLLSFDENYVYSFIKTFPNFLSSIIKFLNYRIIGNKEKSNLYKMRFLGLYNSYMLNKSFYRPYKKN